MSEQIDAGRGMALDELLERGAQGKFELIDGELRAMSPSASKHALLIRALFRALDAMTASGDQWETFSEVSFVPPELSAVNWLRDALVPDVALFDKAAFRAWRAQTPESDSRPIALIPALVAEILSPADRQSDVSRKVQRYLALGVRLVWIIDPQVEQVTVYRHGSKQASLLSAADMLTAEDLLPGFALPLDQFLAL